MFKKKVKKCLEKILPMFPLDYRRVDFCFLLHTLPVCSSVYHETEQGSLLFAEGGGEGRGNSSKENYKVGLGKKKKKKTSPK